MCFTDDFYVPLNFHSYFSLLQGCLSPEEICRYAGEQGYSGIGITDSNNLYGMIRFITAAKNEGIKPVIGVRVVIGKEELFIAYIKNRKGFSLINRLLSSMNEKKESTKKEPRSRAPKYLRSEGQRPDHKPACGQALVHSLHPRDRTAGYLNCQNKLTTIKKNKNDISVKKELILSFILNNGWEGLFLVSDNKQFIDDIIKKGRKDIFIKLLYNRPYRDLIQWAKIKGVPVIALNSAVYIKPSDRILYNILRAIDLNITVDNLPIEEQITEENTENYIAVSSKKMKNYFSAVPEALKNARDLFLKVKTDEILNGDFVFPSFKRMSAENAFSYLKELCIKGIEKRYGKTSEEIIKRLDYELDIIHKKGFSNYFLVVDDIVSQCPRTCGRGSSASSIVSYLLGITHVDPLKYNLFFERFLNLGRKDPPDIDVDFPWDERDKVFSYVFSKYKGRSGMVANHVTFATRSSIHETAKAFAVPEEEIKKIIRLAGLGREEEIPQYIRKMANRIKGFPHYIGVHCGGVVITPGPITDYTHVQYSIQGYPVIAWEKDATEDAGLVKIDLLGNRSLAVLRDSIKLLKQRKSIFLDWDSFNPIHDKGTKELIESGDTLGIFYIESPATRQLLKKMKHGDFKRIIIASSIIRPAANIYIREFVERLHGKAYKPLHPLIDQALKESFGIMVYQEDVSRVAIAIAGFTPEEADLLRKIIAKKNKHLSLNVLKDRFFNGGKKSGIEETVLDEIWEMIFSFRGYSFCKAHSASYALVSYKLAYLKKYYPEEFIVSVINNGGGFYMCQTYLNEAKRMGIKVLAPDINKSNYRYSLEGSSMRIGFCQLKELSTSFIDLIIRERTANGVFTDFIDFLLRLEPSLSEIRILITAGVMDSISNGLNRPQLFWVYFYTDKQKELFLLPPVPAFIEEYSCSKKQYDEIRTMGIMVSRHPLRIFQEKIKKALRMRKLYPFISSRNIHLNINKKVTLAGITVTGKEVRTKNNKHMIFVSFEDPFSIYETVFFPNVYKRFHANLNMAGAFLVCGKVIDEYGALTLDVDNLVSLRVN